MKIDFGLTAGDYARHRVGFPPKLFVRLARFGIGLPGQRILDLGTGTGTLARGWAKQGCQVTAIDRAPAMLAQASRLDAADGVTVRYLVAHAEAVPLASGTFDVVTAGQCWHWFDRTRAAQEVSRLLAHGGRLAICHFDWMPQPGNVVEATERIVEGHNPQWEFGRGIGMYSQWLADVAEAGFRDIESFSFDLDVPYTHDGWCGRMRASSGVAASLPPEKVNAFALDLRAMLARDFPEEILAVAHRVFAVVCRTRAYRCVAARDATG